MFQYLGMELIALLLMVIGLHLVASLEGLVERFTFSNCLLYQGFRSRRCLKLSWW